MNNHRTSSRRWQLKGLYSIGILVAACSAAVAQNEGVICAQQGWGKSPTSCNSGQAAIYALNAQSQCQWFCVDRVKPDLPKDPAMRTPISNLPIFEQISDGSYKMVSRCTNGCPPSVAQLEVTIGDRICPKRCTAQQKVPDGYLENSGSKDNSSDNNDSNNGGSKSGDDCGANCVLHDWASPGALGAVLSSFSDCRKIGTVTPVLDKEGKEIPDLYNCVSWNGDGVKGDDGKIHGLYKMGDNKQWESVADCGSGKMQPMPGGSYLTGSYQCVSSQADDGQTSSGSGGSGSKGGQNAQPLSVPVKADGTCPAGYQFESAGHAGGACALVSPANSAAQNSTAPDSQSADPCAAKYGAGSHRLINGACWRPAKPQSQSSSADGAVQYCPGARWFNTGPSQKPSLDNSSCVDKCDPSAEVTLPWGFKAKGTCIARKEPDMKYTFIQNGAVILQWIPDDSLIGYQAVADCADGATPVYQNYLHNYVCTSASASKAGSQ